MMGLTSIPPNANLPIEFFLGITQFFRRALQAGR